MVTLYLRGGIQEGSLGEIKDFREGHQFLDRDPGLSLLVMLLRKDDLDFHINSVSMFLNSK